MGKRIIENRFSEKAGTYDQYALVQKQMAEQLQQLIIAAVIPEKVTQLLEIGCGTGGLTRLLRMGFSEAKYQAMDLAPGMLDQAKKRVREEGLDCDFLQADIEDWVWEQEQSSLDLIASGACFQWLSKPAQTMKGIGKLLRQGAPLFFSTFGPDTFGELHASFRYAHLCLGQTDVRHGLSFYSGTQWESMLLDAGFEEIQVSSHRVVLTYPSVIDFLHAVKAVGANASHEKAAGLGHRKLLMEMKQHYERTYAWEHGIPVTYELLYIQANRSRNLRKNMES